MTNKNIDSNIFGLNLETVFSYIFQKSECHSDFWHEIVWDALDNITSS